MFWTAYYVFYPIVYIFFFMITWWWQCVECRIYFPNVSESQTRIPQDTFLFPEAALRPGRGACLLPCLHCWRLPSVSVKHWMWQWWEVVNNCPSLLRFSWILQSPPKLIWLFPCVFRHDCSPDETFAFERLQTGYLPHGCPLPAELLCTFVHPHSTGALQACLYHFTLGCFFPIVPWKALSPSHCSWKFQTFPLSWM